MTPEDRNRRLLRARDAMDRSYSEPLDVPTLARVAGSSPAHFIRAFKSAFGETPHRYLQRRRIERAMFLLRQSEFSVTTICFDVGFNSLGTFSRTFREIVGCSPNDYRAEHAGGTSSAPTCFTMTWSRPSSFGEAPHGTRGLASPGERVTPRTREDAHADVDQDLPHLRVRPRRGS